MPRPILIAGPTASGKSALAMALARRLGGAVINADSQQVYREWRILTARPSAEDEAEVPHFLYGEVSIAAAYSAGAWLADAAATLAACRDRALRPIIVGGTGLYFRALTGGLAPIPPIPPEIRSQVESELARLGPQALFRRLAARDPETAAAIDPANPARILRALEVLEATGTGLAEWQRRTGPPLLPLVQTVPLALTPPRELLYARAETRLDAMLEAGVLDEVAQVMALGPAPSLPGMKATGAAELMAHLRGELPLDAALVRAKTATRNYAKRQLTWIRHQMRGWQRLESPEATENLARGLALIENAG